MENLNKIDTNKYYEGGSNSIYSQCEKIAKKNNYKLKEISLNGDRKLINKVKKAGLIYGNPKGEWNGYGYEKLPIHVIIFSISQMRVFNKLIKEVEEERIKQKKKPQIDPKVEWAKRLSKLTGLDINQCLEIANEKIEYKENQIQNLEKRQEERFSIKRQKLIDKIERSNPLRYINDEEHAQNIINASERHNNTWYEDKLELIHEYEETYSCINKGKAKELARTLSFNELRNYLEEQVKW